MQETDPIYATDHELDQPTRRSLLRSLWLPAAIVLVMALIAVIVPFVNVNRFQHRIVSSLSESIGRPIHLDRISLTVLPLPGLTIENLVVGEDPSFGAEPFLRANTVTATLRISSLWRRRVEFTKISFADPSVNLVQNPQGRWNLENILLNAAKIDAAPTAQRRAGSAPRFPYIQATGARINLKHGPEKLPISLQDAEFAVWLNNPQEWRLRLEAHPIRTDLNVTEAGTIRLEGTLGHATALPDVPLDLHAEWANAPLGEASKILLGHDAGLRGSMTLAAATHGTVGKSLLQTDLHLAGLRRADFVPTHTIAVDLHCQAIQTATYTLHQLQCAWPHTLSLSGQVPDLRHPGSATLELSTPGIPAATLLDWAHAASAKLSPDLAATGTLTGLLSFQPVTPGTPSIWTGQLTLEHTTLTAPSVSPDPLLTNDLTLRSSEATLRPHGKPSFPSAPTNQFLLAPLALTLGDHSTATLDGRLDPSGYLLHLAATATPTQLRNLTQALPQLNYTLDDTLPPTTPTHLDLTTTTPWNTPQTWHPTETHTATPPPHHH